MGAGVRQTLGSDELLGALVPIPPSAEQVRIANFLDEQTARIDALIAEKSRLSAALDEYRASLISEVVDGQVAWQSFQLARLRYVAVLNPSIRPDLLITQDIEVSFLPMESIGEDGTLVFDRTRPVSEVRNGYSYFENGDVAIAKVTPCFENGKGALMHGLVLGAGFGTSELTVLRPNLQVISPKFLDYTVRTERFRRLGAGAMMGAGGLKRVPDDFVRNFVLPLPPLSTQKVVVAQLDATEARIKALSAHVEQHITRLREYRSSLISAAVTGQLSCGNAEFAESSLTK